MFCWDDRYIFRSLKRKKKQRRGRYAAFSISWGRGAGNSGAGGLVVAAVWESPSQGHFRVDEFFGVRVSCFWSPVINGAAFTLKACCCRASGTL